MVNFEVLLTVFVRVRFIMLAGVPGLPHLECHLPYLTKEASPPTLLFFAILGSQEGLPALVTTIFHAAFQETAPTNQRLVIICGSTFVASKIRRNRLPLWPSQQTLHNKLEHGQINFLLLKPHTKIVHRSASFHTCRQSEILIHVPVAVSLCVTSQALAMLLPLPALKLFTNPDHRSPLQFSSEAATKTCRDST
jgi:hypothetical protein